MEKYPRWNGARKKPADEVRVFVDEFMPLACTSYGGLAKARFAE